MRRGNEITAGEQTRYEDRCQSRNQKAKHHIEATQLADHQQAAQDDEASIAPEPTHQLAD